jgi:hypothetical protein
VSAEAGQADVAAEPEAAPVLSSIAEDESFASSGSVLVVEEFAVPSTGWGDVVVDAEDEGCVGAGETVGMEIEDDSMWVVDGLAGVLLYWASVSAQPTLVPNARYGKVSAAMEWSLRVSNMVTYNERRMACPHAHVDATSMKRTTLEHAMHAAVHFREGLHAVRSDSDRFAVAPQPSQ